MKRAVKRLDPITQYKEIARQFHEEDPIYQCIHCFRETVHGKETIKRGIVGVSISGLKCSCGKEMTKIESVIKK